MSSIVNQFHAMRRAAHRFAPRVIQLAGVLVVAACRTSNGTSVPPVVPAPNELVILGAPVVRLAAGDSLRLAVELRDTVAGILKPMPRPAVWSSSDTLIATVSATGQVTTRQPGYARVRIQLLAGGEMLIDSIWVHAPSPMTDDQLFSIQFDSTVSDLQRRAAYAATVRWSEIIASALPAIQLNVPAGSCTRGTVPSQSLRDVETGIRIVATTVPLEAAAGTVICQRRPGGTTAAAAVMVSSNALYAGLSEATWATIWFHELGHALGLVADLLIPPGQLLNSPAMLAGFQHDYGRAVAGITYSQQAHWVNVPGDIMDGSTGTRATVVGRTTLGRLKDMGYPVTLTQSGPLDLERTARRMFTIYH